jgi:serpin B
VQFQSSSSIWARAGVSVLPTFLEAAEQCCNATLLPLPGHDAVAAVNAWVASATEGKIPVIVSSLAPNVSLMVVNAAYFRGSWTSSFDRNLTNPGPFRLDSGATKTVPFMHRVGQFAYVRGSNFDWVRLPYGDGLIVMDLLLPPQDRPSIEFLDTLLAVGDPQSASAPILKTGRLQLPQFATESASALNKSLTALGLGDLFKLGVADFSRLSSNTTALAVDDVRHSVAISIDESGTEAAAATSVTMVGSLPPSVQEFELRFDHTFLFAIRDTRNGMVLFVGLIRDPGGRPAG